jgi:hypothetical protein
MLQSRMGRVVSARRWWCDGCGSRGFPRTSLIYPLYISCSSGATLASSQRRYRVSVTYNRRYNPTTVSNKMQSCC